MTHLALVIWVVVFPTNHVQSMPERRHVDEFVVDGENERARQQPNQYEWHFHPTTHWNSEENHLHDEIGDWLHEGVDSVINGS